MLHLNCWLLGDDPRRVFTVKIPQSETVDGLKNAIKKAKTPVLDDIAADSLDLWQVKIDLKKDRELLNTIQLESIREAGKELEPEDEVCEVLTEILKKHLHIVVQRPPTPTISLRHLGSQTIGDEEKRLQLDDLQKSFIKLALKRPSPSQAAKGSNFGREQNECPMLVGRPSDKQGLPVGLYNPIFDEFMALMSDTTTDTDITHDHLSNTSTFCHASVAIYRYEHERRQAMTHMVDDLVHAPLTGMLARNKASSDGTIMTIAHGISLYRAILEWKNDMGEGGCDAVKQGCYSFRNYWIQPSLERARNACNCPSFIIAISGPWLVVLGAVFVEFPVIQPLTDYIWLGVHPSADTQLLRVARLFVALRRALQSLDTFYTKLNIPADPTAPTNLARFFPHIQSFPTANGDVQFEYVIKLADESPTKAVFKAKIAKGGDRIVVKFVQTYNFTAHRLLAAHSLAPRLLYPENAADEPTIDVGGLKLVVMDFVDGVTAHDAYGNAATLPEVIFDEVEKAIEVLHKNGLVFGDLRPPNVMISDGRAHLVDFDWCAKDGMGRYPVSLNDVDRDIGWHPDVKRGSVMYKQHDIFMLRKFRRG